MQDAGPRIRHLRALLVALAALGTLVAGFAGVLVGWQAAVLVHVLLCTACLAALLHEAGRGTERHALAPSGAVSARS